MSNLIFRRAPISRLSGGCNEDDYDVLADGVVVGRIRNWRSFQGQVVRFNLLVGVNKPIAIVSDGPAEGLCYKTIQPDRAAT